MVRREAALSRLAVVACATALGARLATVSLTTGCGLASVDAGSVDACSQIDADVCFSNLDCAAAVDHCTLSGLDADDNPVTCCVPGPRGTLEAGAPCASLDDCPTAVCTFTNSFSVTQPAMVCSPSCTSNAECASQVPAMLLPKCVTFPPDGGNMFCGIGP